MAFSALEHAIAKHEDFTIDYPIVDFFVFVVLRSQGAILSLSLVEEGEKWSSNDHTGQERRVGMKKRKKDAREKWRRFQLARGAPERCLMMTHGKTNCGSNGLQPQLAAHRVLLLPCCAKLQWCGKTPEEGASLCLLLICILVFQALNVHKNVKRMLITLTNADRETVKRMDRGAGTKTYRRTSRLEVSQRGKYKQRDKTREPQMAGWMDGWRAEWGMWKWWINWWTWEKMD